jgi:hypothetical protein
MEIFSPQPARLLDLVREDVEVAVSTLRPKFGPLQIDGMARRLRLALMEYDFRGPVRGATIKDSLVLLDRRLSGSLRAEVFAHEVGHVLHRRGYFARLSEHEVELFADQFARELLAPGRWLTGERHSGEQLARRLGVRRSIVALQLAAIGAAPSLMRDRDTVLCATCGTWPHVTRCRCRRFRQDQRALQRLPDYRALPAFDQPDPPLRPLHAQLTFAAEYLERSMKANAI